MNASIQDRIDDLTAQIAVVENKPVMSRSDHDLSDRLRAERLALRKLAMSEAPLLAAE